MEDEVLFDPWLPGRMTNDLNRLLKLAISIFRGTGRNDDYTFGSILFAFLIAKDPISKSFQQFIIRSGFKEEDFKNFRPLYRRGTVISDFREFLDKINYEVDAKDSDRLLNPLIIKENAVTITQKNQEKTTERKRGLYQVAYEKILQAVELLDQNFTTTQSVALDVRHLMGAYIYKTSNEEYEQNVRPQWKNLQLKEWSNAFLSEIKALFPDELGQWTTIHRNVFRSEPNYLFYEMAKLSAQLSTDIWTLEDKLHYRIFAIALARFITSENTIPPVSISIQAPWGGGKTSLMRMVQAELDRDGAERALVRIRDDKSLRKAKLRELKLFGWKIKYSKKGNNQQDLKIHDFESGGEQVKPLVTVWFNAWKYESTEQVWAGLADSIVREIAERMNPVEREWFFLQLNLHRIDKDRIRQWIYERSLSHFWQKMRHWLPLSITALTGFIILHTTGVTIPQSYILNIDTIEGIKLNMLFLKPGLYGIIGTIVATFFQSIRTMVSNENEPAEVSLGKYVNVPDYNDKLGFIHHVSEDLQIIFNTIPEKYLPMVVFIDDLDRCSPKNIAEVIEGINLFLAGDFKQCMFVLGMDAEMIAAALEVAHKEVIEKLPKYSTYTPMGWKFMDKFIQLPIVLPPSVEIKEYISSVLDGERQQEIKKYGTVSSKDTDKMVQIPIIERLVHKWIDKLIIPKKRELEDKKQKLPLYSKEETPLVQAMAKAINTISDEDPEFRKQITEAASYFSSNPREIKRFINILRFQRNVMTGIGFLSPTDKPSFDILRRWIILSIKWPSVIRWLYWTPGGKNSSTQNETNKNNVIRERLLLLENTARECKDQSSWQKEIEYKLHIKATEVTWITDEALRAFFNDEGTIADPNERISSKIGKGLY